MKKHWGFILSDRDTKTRPQDDFYRHAGGAWLDAHPIPKTESRWGSFILLRYDTDKKLRAIIQELLSRSSLPRKSPERLIHDFYQSAIDVKTRNALGISPLSSWIKKIEAIESQKNLLTCISGLQKIGVDVPFGVAVDQDSKKSTRYILHVYQSGLGLPDRDYYLKDDGESVRVRTAYLPHITSMFKLMGYTAKDAKQHADTVFQIETALARVSMTKEERRDADKTYHKKTLSTLKKLAPAISWKNFFEEIGAGMASEVIVMQPKFIAEVAKMLTRIPLSEWKTYLTWHLVNEYAPYLSNRFVNEDFAFSGVVLSGAKAMKPLWRRALKMTEAELGELLGRLYVKKHFTATAKRKMDQLVDDLFEAYEARLKNIPWMGSATKAKALRKLRALNRKIGYPKRWRSYAGLTIRKDDLVGNVMRSTTLEHKRQMKKLGKRIDRDEWFMFPQTVNAYFAPTLNDIVFPAAILQPPFFHPDADDAVNYGSIGTVIGHEITHGFDDQGSKYDAHGNLKSWWTAKDRKEFEKRAKVLRKQFDSYTVSDGVRVNGQLTLGENIADLGGLLIAYDAYQRRLEKTGRVDVDGITPEQRFFYGFSLFEREHSRPEFEKMAALTDPHSPAKFRVNGPLSNAPAFYDAFSVTQGDVLHRSQKDIADIW